jgi:hypothetical protein
MAYHLQTDGQSVLRFLGTIARSEIRGVLLTQDLSLGFDLRLKS